MIIEPSNYMYETMPDYTDAVDGAVEIPVTGEEIEIRYAHEVVYDEAHNLHLEIFTPFQMAHPERTWPCITFIQGSAWMKQYVYQKVGMIARLAQRGYVVAIVEYRHSGIAHFPAQIIDAKNAVRFLRAHADEYKLNPSQMFLMGDSSGGQVSSVAGMTAKSGKLDEPINEESCEVCGIIDLYGAVDVTLPYGYPITLNHQKPDSPEGMLMGYDITEHLEEAKAACSKTYVNEDFPPMLIAHGTKDTMVFCQQSVDLYHALKDASVLDAKKMANRGVAAKDIKAILEEDALDASIYIMVDTLKYLKKGGRVTPAAAMIGTVLNIKPVLTIQGEKLDAFEKARGVKQAKKAMIKAMKKDMDKRFAKERAAGIMGLHIAYTANDKEVIDGWIAEVKEAFPDFEVDAHPLSLSIACHIGPGALAIACEKKSAIS